MCECSPCWSPDNILVRFSFPVHISQVSFSLHYIAEFPFFYILCLYCLLLICSSIDELLGCFHVLAIKHLFGTLLLILLYRYPEVELLHHTVILFLISWGAAILFSNGCAILHFFPTVHRSPSNFSTILTFVESNPMTFLICQVFGNCLPWIPWYWFTPPFSASQVHCGFFLFCGGHP